MKKTIAFLAAVVMLLVSFPSVVMTASAALSGDWDYTVSANGTATIVYYTGNAQNVTVPSVIDGHTVTRIGISTFRMCDTMQTLTIPATVNRIPDEMFGGCSSLKKVTVDKNNANYCDVDGVLFDKKKTTLLYYPCARSATEYTVPNTVKEIRQLAFGGCKVLKRVVIPNSVTTIRYYAFYSCESLESVTLGGGIRSMEDNAFARCPNLKNVTFTKGITTIGDFAFNECKRLNNAVIPNSVTYIGKCAFYNCKELENVAVPDSVNVIGGSAFGGCSKLQTITLPDTVIQIGADAFSGTAYEKSGHWIVGVLYVGKHLISVSGVLEGRCEVRSGTLTIANGAFDMYGVIDSVTIPESVKYIGETAFENCFRITDVYYEGNRAGWYDLTVGKEPMFSSMTIHYGKDGFPDVKEGAWYYDAVQYVTEKGYMSGYKNGRFGPANSLQRQDFVVTLARIAGADLTAYEGQAGTFSDVNANAYYAPSVAWAVDNGIITGYNAEKFGVGDVINREQVCTILYRYTGEPTVENAAEVLAAFPDAGRISGYAQDAMAWAVQNGVISGTSKGTVSPKTGASRAQIATIIMRMGEKGLL